MSGYQELVADSVKLVSLPDIYLRVRVALNDPESSAADLGDVLRTDPGLTARLLKLANSPFYGFRARVETVTRAVALLGRQQIHDMVLATSVARTFGGVPGDDINMGQFWRNSVYSALVCRLLAKMCNVLDSERLFVHGLLRDIGHLLMYQKVPELTHKALVTAQEESRALTHLEQEIIGYDYTQVGGELMRVWDMPQAMRHSIRYQMEPASAEEYLLDASIVHIAALLTTVIESNEDADFFTLPFAPDALRVTRVSEETLHKLRLESRSYLEEACSFLLPEGALDDASLSAR